MQVLEAAVCINDLILGKFGILFLRYSDTLHFFADFAVRSVLI